MALERFGSAQDVSIFFFVLGILGVGMSLAVPWLVRRLSRRGTFWLGAVSGVVSMLLSCTTNCGRFVRVWHYISLRLHASMSRLTFI